MADEASSSLQARVRALPFPAVLALGGLTGLLGVALAALSVEPVAEADASATSTRSASEAPKDANANAGPTGAEAVAASPSASAAGRPTAADDQPEADTAKDAELDDDTAIPEEPDAEEDAEEDAEAEVEVDPQPDVGASPAVEAGSNAKAPAPPPTKSSDRSAEADATPDELFAMAKAAYDEGEYRDAYRLATKSQRAKASDRTQMLRGRSACRLKDEKNAKAIVRSFKLGDERRKTLRTFCKDRGVRVGL